MFYQAPTYNLDTLEWTHTDFESRKETIFYIKDKFKYPGQYNLKYSDGVWNEQAKIFQVNEKNNGRGNGHYPKYVNKSIDFRKHWDAEKEKCKFDGFIIYKKPSEDLEYVVPCLYYWYLNYCPIPDKVKARDDFPEIYDGDLHYYLYILQCILLRKYGVVLKKRQSGYTLKNMSILLNAIWFGESAVSKIFAKDEKKVKDSWKFMEKYRDHINRHAGWKRGCDPNQILNWQIRRKQTDGSYKGNMSIAQGFTTKQDPTNGIGGCNLKGTLVKMADGTLKAVEFIKKGDYVVGADGYPKRVLNLFSGVDLMYSVEQSNGISYVVTRNHKLYLYDHYKDENITILAEDFDKESNYRKTRKLSGVKYLGNVFFNKELPIDPYYLGLYLGDGCKNGFHILVNRTKDPEIFDYVNKLAEDNGYIFTNYNKNKSRPEYKDEMWNVKLSIKGRKLNTIKNSYRTHFQNMNLSNKHIPEIYKTSSREQRLQLLAGIIDTDGHYSKEKNRYVVTAKLDSFAKDIQELCIDLGFTANIHITKNKGRSSTVYNKPTVINTIQITGDIWNIPVKVKRKKAIYNKSRNTNRYSKLLVREYGLGEYYGFECEDHLYVLEDGTITHNSATVIFGEESGANDTLDVTHEFITSNVALGGLTTGLIMYSGAVGELDKADPLKEFIFHPEDHDFLACNNYIEDDLDLGPKVGFFAPEWWNYVSVEEDEDGNQFGDVLKCFDEWGNSDKEKALAEIKKHRKKAENKSPEKYRYYCSQRPLSIKEAFAHRKDSVWPLNLVAKQKQRIENKEYPHEYLDIDLDENGQIAFSKSNKLPIREFPLSKTSADKEGCIEVWERPCAKPEFGMYYASIDPLKIGKTVTSLSLFCIYIYKNDVEVTKVGAYETETYIEPGKLVATWVGRFDDINATNKRAQYLIEIYNAWTLVEANADQFITHMINVKKHHYLVPKGQIMFLKELNANLTSFQDYGWKNTGDMFRRHMIPYGVSFLKEELDAETIPDGTKVKIIYGIERIPDIMLLKEIEAYHSDLNVDRLIAFCALAAFVKVQNANRGYMKRVEKDETAKLADKSLYVKENSFFKTKKSVSDSRYNVKKTGFRNLK